MSFMGVCSERRVLILIQTCRLEKGSFCSKIVAKVRETGQEELKECKSSKSYVVVGECAFYYSTLGAWLCVRDVSCTENGIVHVKANSCYKKEWVTPYRSSVLFAGVGTQVYIPHEICYGKFKRMDAVRSVWNLERFFIWILPMLWDSLQDQGGKLGFQIEKWNPHGTHKCRW